VEPSLKIIYSRQHSLASLFIRISSWWGPWSHCGIVDGDYVIESRALEGGVVKNTLSHVLEKSSNHQIVEVYCPNPEKGLEWARSTIGKPYDWGGIFAIFFRKRQWQNKDKWYCSEHVEQTLIAAGKFRFRDGLNGISPNQSFFVR
jgi:uncharacterized protein YycO